MRTVWVGTSGWVYKEWAGHFYPKGWPKKAEFRYYVRHFPSVEINATFYRLPTKKMVRGWREKSPEGFTFAVKGSRYLTHIRRLNDTSKGLQKYFRRIVPLGDRTGPILWQLPPNFQKTAETFKRLERFLARLPKAYRHAIEFRHPSWMDEETFALLRKHAAANVWISSLRMPADYTITSDFVYLRFHGLKDGAYHDYTDEELEPWAKQLAAAARRGIPGYVYFNNDLNTRAPLNAVSLIKRLGKHAVRAFAADPATRVPEIAPPVKGPETWRPWTRRVRDTVANSSKAGAPARNHGAKTRRKKSAASRSAGSNGTGRRRTERRRAFAAEGTGGNRRTLAARTRTVAAPTRRQSSPGVRRITAPGRSPERRFAAAQFSASALPPAR